MPRYHLYLRRVALLLVICLCFIGALNVIIDPYGLFRIYEKTGFNQQKEGVRLKIRLVKALELPLRQPQTILLGTSRIQSGINPTHQLLQSYPPVYNLGIDNLHIFEATQYLKHALKNSKIKRVILGVDFFMFNANDKTLPGYDPELLDKNIKWFDYTKLCFSRGIFKDAYRTVLISRRLPKYKTFLSNGFRPAIVEDPFDYVNTQIYWLWLYLSQRPPFDIPYFSVYVQNDESFNDFENLLALCQKNGIDCHVFISPGHATLEGEGIRVSRLWEKFEHWKLRLTEISYRYHVPLWDFSGYNSITTEVPHSHMKYFYDPAHYSEAIGALMLARMLGGSNLQKIVPADFGVKCTPDNIASHLQSIQKARMSYAERRMPEIELIEKMNASIQANMTRGDFEAHNPDVIGRYKTEDGL